MSRLIPLLSLLVTLAGCATTSGTVYHYGGGGDYYSASDSADLMGYSSGPGYGLASGYGYGYGFGFGYGLGGYPGWWSPWYSGYSPYVWLPVPSAQYAGSWREPRVQRDRALRSSIAARPTIAAPMRAAPGWRQAPPLRAAPIGASRAHADVHRPAIIRPASASSAPARTSAAPMMRSAPPPPPPRDSSRKH